MNNSLFLCQATTSWQSSCVLGDAVLADVLSQEQLAIDLPLDERLAFFFHKDISQFNACSRASSAFSCGFRLTFQWFQRVFTLAFQHILLNTFLALTILNLGLFEIRFFTLTNFGLLAIFNNVLIHLLWLTQDDARWFRMIRIDSKWFTMRFWRPKVIKT